MSKREEYEENRIRKNIKDRKDRNRSLKHKRNLKLAIFCSIFTIIVLLGAAFIILHSISHKESLRDAGIAAFNEGNYNEAISDLESSLGEEQWFSKNMDDDTRLYLAACYMRTDDYTSALDYYNELKVNQQKVISEDTLNSFIDLATSLNEIKSGNVNEAYINSLLKEYDRGNKSISLYLGNCYQAIDDKENMLKYYNDYIENFGINTFVAYQLSTYYIETNNLDAAASLVNQGLSAGDDMYKDLVLFNDIILSEKQLDYSGALAKAESLMNAYPNSEIYKREYDFLNSRVNYDPTPVNTEGDAVTY